MSSSSEIPSTISCVGSVGTVLAESMLADDGTLWLWELESVPVLLDVVSPACWSAILVLQCGDWAIQTFWWEICWARVRHLVTRKKKLSFQNFALKLKILHVRDIDCVQKVVNVIYIFLIILKNNFHQWRRVTAECSFNRHTLVRDEIRWVAIRTSKTFSENKIRNFQCSE